VELTNSRSATICSVCSLGRGSGFVTGLDCAPFTHGAEGKYDNHCRAYRGTNCTNERTDASPDAGIAGDLEIDKGITDNSARSATNEDGKKGENSGSDTGQGR